MADLPDAVRGAVLEVRSLAFAIRNSFAWVLIATQLSDRPEDLTARVAKLQDDQIDQLINEEITPLSEFIKKFDLESEHLKTKEKQQDEELQRLDREIRSLFVALYFFVLSVFLEKRA